MAPLGSYFFLLLLLLPASAVTSAHQGQNEQLAQVTAMIQQRPDDQALFIRRGAIHVESRHFDAAADDFRRAEELGPAARVAFDWGVLYHEKADFERAIGYYDIYLNAFPGVAIVYEHRARAAREQGDVESAVADLRRYFELLDKPHPGNYIAAATMLDAMGEPGEALNLLDAGMHKLGVTPSLQRAAITLERDQGNMRGALARLETLRQPLRDSPDWKLEMARLLSEDGQTPRAVMLLQEIEVTLSAQRVTPAREALLEQSRALRDSLSASPSR